LAFLADNGESLARFCDPDNTKRETERLCRPLNNEKVSLDGINFIFMLLKPDPTKRPEARRCLDHSWTNPVSPTTADSVIPQETAETANLVNLDGSWGTISSSTGLWLGQETAEQDDKLAGQEAKGDQPPGPGPVRMLSDASKASGSWSVTFKAADTVQRMTTVGEEPQVEALAQSSPRQTRSLSEQISVVPHHSSTSPPCTHFTSSHPSQLYGMGLASQNRTFSVPTQTPSTNGSYIIHPPQPYGTGLANQGRAVSMPAQTPSPQGSYTSHPPQYDDSGYHSPASLQVSPVPTKNHDAWTGAGAGITAFETPPGPRRGDSMAEIMSGSPIERWTTDPGAYMGNQYPQYTASPRASMDSLMPGYGPHPAPRVRNIQNTPSPKTSFDSLSPDSLPRAAHRVRSRVSFSSDTDRGNTGPGAYTTNRHSQHAPSPGASFDSLMPDDMLHTARRVRSMVSVGSNSNAIQWERQIEVGLSSRCVMTLTLSDNGQYGASWCQDSILRVWDPRSGQHRGQSEIKDVTSLLFSPDSAILAVRTKRALKLFMMKEPPFRMSRRVTIDGNHTVDRPFASECMFSKDSQRIAVPSAGTGRVWLLYTADGALLGKLDTSGASVTSIAISPYLRTLAVGLGDNTVRTWNLQDYSERKTLRHNACAPAHVTRVAYSINGLVAASSTSGILKIWDEDGCTVETRPQGCRLLDCAFCPVGDLVATADDGGCIRFFDPTTAAELESHYIQHKEQGPVLRVLFSPDGVFGVSCGYKTLEVWHTATANVLYRSQLQSNDGCGVKACFSKGHDILAVAFEGGVQLLDLGILRARITV
jgi:WD40 repeat protein